MSPSTQISGIPRKKSRKTDNVKHYHISNLPDGVISHILSLLPTKDAVKTSILSKDWEYKWTSIHSIELDDSENYRKKANFANCVDRALLLVHNVQNFHLSCIRKYEIDRMKTWISAALSRNLLCLQISYRHASIVLPPNLLNCHSLRKLDLKLPCTFKVPPKICFPYLTTLKLEGVKISSEVSNSGLIKFNFPVMETFEVIECTWLNIKLVEIYAPKMTKFGVVSDDASVINNPGDGLVKFDSWGGLPENIVLSDASDAVYVALRNLCRASDFDYHERCGLQFRTLLKGFLNLKDLLLCGYVAQAIALSKLGVSLPRYDKLKQLVIHYSFRNPEEFFELLHAAPFLRILDIYVIPWSDYDYDYDGEENLPPCIVSHLEEVKFSHFVGSVHELKLTKFFLKNAIQLKSLCVDRRPSKSIAKKEIYETGQLLSTYPKGSACVTIVIKHKRTVLKF